MANTNKSAEAQATAMIERLRANTKANEKNAVDMPDGFDVFKDTLPKGVTTELLESIAEHHRQFDVAYQTVAGETCINHMKSNKDVANMEHRLHTPLIDFGFSVARLDLKDGQKPTREQARSSFAFRHEVKLSDQLSGVEEQLLSLYDLAD
jgi:hypothetical protein